MINKKTEHPEMLGLLNHANQLISVIMVQKNYSKYIARFCFTHSKA